MAKSKSRHQKSKPPVKVQDLTPATDPKGGLTSTQTLKADGSVRLADGSVLKALDLNDLYVK